MVKHGEGFDLNVKCKSCGVGSIQCVYDAGDPFGVPEMSCNHCGELYDGVVGSGFGRLEDLEDEILEEDGV